MKKQVILLASVVFVAILMASLVSARPNINPQPQPTQPPGTSLSNDCSKVSKIAAKNGSLGMVMSNGSVYDNPHMIDYNGGDALDYAWGMIDGDAIGLSSNSVANEPFSKDCVLTDSKKVFCSNYTYNVQQGDILHGYEQVIPDPSGSPGSSIGASVEKISMGEGHFCTLYDDKSLICMGEDDHNQSMKFPFADPGILDVSTYEKNTCVVTNHSGNSGYVLCRGKNVQNIGSSSSNKNIPKDSNTNGLNFISDSSNYVKVALASDHVCMLEYSSSQNSPGANVVCKGENWFGQSVNYASGDAVDVAVGKGYTCVLKNNGNVSCYGLTMNGLDPSYDTNNPASMTWDNYTKGDAIDLAASNDGNFNVGDRFYCILNQYNNTKCFQSGTNNAATNYSCNLPPGYSGFSLQQTAQYEDNVTVQASINWNDFENNFSTSYLETNISGSPQNVSTVQSNSHTYSQNISQTGTYYVKFYGEDKAGVTNFTGKQIFEVRDSAPSSFYWENSSSGNQISSVYINDTTKTVNMVADYNSPSVNNVYYYVYETGTSNILMNVTSASVTGPNSQDPNATLGFDVNDSLFNKISKPYNISFNVSTSILNPSKASSQGRYIKDSSGTDVYIPYPNTSKSQTLSIKDISTSTGYTACPINKDGVNCTSPGYCSANGTEYGGSQNSYSCDVLGLDGGTCCNLNKSKDPLCPFSNPDNRHCSDYETKSNCENNVCGLMPEDTEGCTGSNCGCAWNSTGSDEDEGACLGYVNHTNSSEFSGDGTCYYVGDSSDTCQDDGKLNYSWSVRWENSSGSYGPASAPSTCQPGTEISPCPSVAKLPLENGFTIPLTILVLVGVYVFFYSRTERFN